MKEQYEQRAPHSKFASQTEVRTYRLVHLVAGGFRLGLLGEGNEAEASGAACLSVHNNIRILNLAELGKSLQ